MAFFERLVMSRLVCDVVSCRSERMDGYRLRTLISRSRLSYRASSSERNPSNAWRMSSRELNVLCVAMAMVIVCVHIVIRSGTAAYRTSQAEFKPYCQESSQNSKVSRQLFAVASRVSKGPSPSPFLLTTRDNRKPRPHP